MIQIESVILPTTFYATLNPTVLETVNDVVEHTSIEFDVPYLQEKNIFISATEVVAAGFPGPLLCWVELSPVLSTTSAAYWAAIGGGGGAIAPTAPVTIVSTGVNATVHSFMIPWNIHSRYARLVVQTPAIVATAWWLVQAIVSGK